MRIPNRLHHEILPGILEQEWEPIEKKLELVKPFAKTIHIDILDGVFAPNTTFLDPTPFKKYADEFFFEVHMMVDNPVTLLKPWADAGCKRFIGQVEMMPDMVDFVAQGQLLGEVGLALDTPTSVEKLAEIDLEDLDFAFVMTVKAGFSRQSFMPEMLEKVKALRARDPLIPIEVDGGISDSSIVLAKDAGATRFVSTGFIFDGDATKNYETLCGLVK